MTESEIEKQAEEYAIKITDELKNKGFLTIGEISQRYAGIVQGVKWGAEHAITEANEIIKDLLYCTDGIVVVSIPEENRFLSVKKLKARAEKFLKECKE